MDAVSQPLQSNLEALWAFLARWPGWTVHIEKHLAWCESPIAHESFNKVIRCHLPKEEAVDVLCRLRDQAWAKQRSLGFWLEQDASSSHLRELLPGLGFQPRAQAWGMVTTLATKPQVTNQVPVVAVVGHELWPQWLTVFGEGFALPWEVVEAYGEQLSLGLSASSPLLHLAALLHGRVVGTASLFFDEQGIAGLYNLAVALPYRGQGVADALVHEALRRAAAAGCHLVVLRSSAEAFSVYLRWGFQVVVRYAFLVASSPGAVL